jgi:putative glutamine amidotransferase
VSARQPLIGITTYKSGDGTPAQNTLYALNPLYSHGVVAVGGAPLQIPHGVDTRSLRTIFDHVDGLLLSGGGDVDPAFYHEPTGDEVRGVDRERDEIEIELVRWAVEEGKPVFAICRGIQVMNVALGGSLYQDVLSDMPGAMRHAYVQGEGYPRDFLAHDVQLTANSRVAHLLDGDHFPVNSLHHQGIKQLAPELTVVGTAPDGLVEAVEIEGHSFAVGVQWHPEALAPKDAVMRGLFGGLVAAARNSRDPH